MLKWPLIPSGNHHWRLYRTIGASESDLKRSVCQEARQGKAMGVRIEKRMVSRLMQNVNGIESREQLINNYV